ncbi:MAG TPA: hypothetical protein VLB27_10430, partial [candidate division Zixibacteria bacterium]|nr:hypothetical protein [candidate division Zixibacteria bacterium]
MSHLTRALLGTCVCLLTISGATHAQQGAPATDAHNAALEVYLAGFNPMKADGIPALADYIHPDELA